MSGAPQPPTKPVVVITRRALRRVPLAAIAIIALVGFGFGAFDVGGAKDPSATTTTTIGATTESTTTNAAAILLATTPAIPKVELWMVILVRETLQYEPTSIHSEPACASSAVTVRTIHWTSWTTTQATGTGTWVVPTRPSGYPTAPCVTGGWQVQGTKTVTLSNPQTVTCTGTTTGYGGYNAVLFTTSTPPGLVPPATYCPGTYQNPLRAISNLVPRRIDQGVDYSGSGPIYAIGNGVVLNTFNTGWPGGAFISYELSDGPAAGDIVYVAENVVPEVRVGQRVTPSTVLGTLVDAYPYLETGWAAAPGTGESAAAAAGQWSAYADTVNLQSAFGANFSELLVALGAPPGLSKGPVQGSLPTGWPTL